MTRTRFWLPGRIDGALKKAVVRLERTTDVAAIAVMPDAHLAEEVCVGTVVATTHRLFPDAVGGDIGCGMSALAFDGGVQIDERHAERIFAGLRRAVPILKQRAAVELPSELGLPTLESKALRDGARQLGTLGRGNHFLELQVEGDRLWLMVHSGSRAMGRAIRQSHLRACEPDATTGLRFLDAESDAGRAYRADMAWARRYARLNRRRIAEATAELLHDVLGLTADWDTCIDADHNHVVRESHEEQTLWVHRKGANAAFAGALAVIPGSMGSVSHHVVGRGHEPALCSSSHGAGRAMSRSEARRRIRMRDFERETRGVWIDESIRERLKDEAPSAYKDIGKVMRAQKEMVKIVRTLRPLLCFKGA